MTRTLCIDIGGTRIKSAILKENLSLDDLKATSSIAIRTVGWLNHSLANLLKEDHWEGLAYYYGSKRIPYDRIAVSVPGVVDDHGCFGRSDLVDGPAKLPRELRDALQEAAGKPVTLIKDADAWMLGFIRYAALRGENFDYPVLLLAFGTGVGVSAAGDSGTIHSIEISQRPANAWATLKERSRYEITEGWQVHRILGRRFFEWVEDERRDWSYVKMREEFSARVEAALVDLRPSLEGALGRLRTIVLAGGNAEFVSVSRLGRLCGCRVVDLTERHAVIKPDLISLLGVETSIRTPSPRTLKF